MPDYANAHRNLPAQLLHSKPLVTEYTKCVQFSTKYGIPKERTFIGKLVMVPDSLFFFKQILPPRSMQKVRRPLLKNAFPFGTAAPPAAAPPPELPLILGLPALPEMTAQKKGKPLKRASVSMF